MSLCIYESLGICLYHIRWLHKQYVTSLEFPTVVLLTYCAPKNLASHGSESLPHPCQRCSKCLFPDKRDSGLTMASAFPAPSISLYLGKSCSTSQSLSQGDGRGTPWGRSPAGSLGGHPDRCTGCRAGVQRSGRLGSTPPHGSTSFRHAHRLGQRGQEGRRVSALDSHQSPVIGEGGILGSPCSTSLAQPPACKGCQGIQPVPHP